jgi:hypothetical protein
MVAMVLNLEVDDYDDFKSRWRQRVSVVGWALWCVTVLVARGSKGCDRRSDLQCRGPLS